jgi:5-methylcytosine-specific restriction endonuclease McrA
MWHLDNPDKETLAQYTKYLEQKLYDSINEYTGHKRDSLKKELLPRGSYDVIHRLLTEKPHAALELNNKLMGKLLKAEKKSYNEEELPDYQRIKRMKSPCTKNKEIFNRYDCILKRLGTVFKYDTWISGNSKFAYWLSKVKGVRTCTYCGREYIFTVEGQTPEDRIRHIARPDFDHFLSQELYPLLSLNYFNLIPCCPICNRTVKGTKVLNLVDYVHPYLRQTDPLFRFSFQYKDDSLVHGEVTIEDDADQQEYNTLEAFKLRAFYKEHSEIELDDLLRLTQKNGKQYIEEYLLKIMEGLDITKSDAYRSIFGGEIINSMRMERPLSKFKRDILTELGVMDFFREV